MAEVILKDLVKIYKDGNRDVFKAVNSINLDIRDREFMVLVGPSGCGKSTSLRMIAGLEEITDGTISIDGRVVNDVQPKDRDIAMVFQNYALYPHMTVRENMGFGLKLMKFPKKEIAQRVDEAAEILGIESLLDRKPKALSGGQRQRVAVGRAIVRQPKVFLFDEPLSNLDAKMRVQMRTEISKLHSRLSATMVYVTHDQVEAMTMGDRICVMRDGDIMQVDDPITLYNNPRNMFVAGFIGSPPMNLLHGTLNEESGELYFIEKAEGENKAKFPLKGKIAEKARKYSSHAVVFGIRPEDISVVGQRSASEMSAVVDATVEVSEPMGSETYLYLTTANNTLIARVESTARYKSRDSLKLVFNTGKAHLFDPSTEETIV